MILCSLLTELVSNIVHAGRQKMFYWDFIVCYLFSLFMILLEKWSNTMAATIL